MRILLVVDPLRFDFYSYLSKFTSIDFFLLWYEKKSQMKKQLDDFPLKFKKVFFWTDFATSNQLLKEIRADKIVFFEIIDLRQIALLTTAKKNRITTFYLEHGAAGDKDAAMNLWMDEELYRKTKFPYLINRLKSLKDVFLSKLFYYSVINKLTSVKSFWKYSLLPFKMIVMMPNKALIYTMFDERIPDFAIVFNKVNYEQFKIYTGLDRSRAILTGIPHFDRFYSNAQIARDHIVYIDHPYLEGQMLNWTKEHHETIASTIFNFAKSKKITIYIKLHPFSNKQIWESYNYNSDFIKIIQDGDFTNLFLEAKLIMGFSSSLINGFLCAKKNVVLLGWHPIPHIFGSDFSKTKLCHISYHPEELESKFEEWSNTNLALENDGAYKEFLFNYNHPFDGKATERVINAILMHEVS